MYCNETKKGWTSHIPTAGGWWKISKDEYNLYHLSFIVVASLWEPVVQLKGTFNTLHDLFVELSEEE